MDLHSIQVVRGALGFASSFEGPILQKPRKKNIKNLYNHMPSALDSLNTNHIISLYLLTHKPQDSDIYVTSNYHIEPMPIRHRVTILIL